MPARPDVSPNLVQEVLGGCGLPVKRQVADQVCTYMRALEKWNEKMNLTAVVDPLKILKDLFGESFLGAKLLEPGDSPCLDVGSGAGFPGMAMKIFRPDLEMVLMEPRQKRVAFLSALRRELGFPEVEILPCRIEACQAADFKQVPVTLVSRGVGNQLKILQAGRQLLTGLRRILLFTTPQLALPISESKVRIHWAEPVPIPWNAQHVLLRGHWIS